MEPDRNLGHLYPPFAAKAQTIFAEMDAWLIKHLPGTHCWISEGFRTLARQKELYAQGRTKPGPIVTEKDGVNRPSNHQSGLAIDFAFMREGEPTWDVPNEAWQYLRHLAHTQGLTSGSDWTTFKRRAPRRMADQRPRGLCEGS